ncbi:MAG: sigma-70 family RNA polymerase sigma factor [bacterium]|nr:sigma-70 family RNA polymerase sigma factor [bacterium]
MNYKKINDYELLYMIEENNEDAFQTLYEKYLPLLRKLTGDFYLILKKYNVEYDDLFQEAHLAFISAMRKYQAEEGTLFFTFLYLSIRSKLLNCMRGILSNKAQICSKSISLSVPVSDDDLILEEVIPDTSILSFDHSLYIKDLFAKLHLFSLELNSIQGQIFELLCNGFEIGDISLLLEMDARAIHNNLYRIRTRLKKYLTSFHNMEIVLY